MYKKLKEKNASSKEEHRRASISNLAVSHGLQWTGDARQDEMTFYQMKEKLRVYERIQVENLLQELKNKTHLIERLIEEKKELERRNEQQKTQKPLPKRSTSPLRLFPDLRWNAPSGAKLDPAQTRQIAGAAEPDGRPELLQQMRGLQESVDRLSSDNQILIKLLEAHKIEVPNLMSEHSAMGGIDRQGKVGFTVPDMPKPPSRGRLSSARSHSTRFSGNHDSNGTPDASPFVIPRLDSRKISRPPSSSAASQRTLHSRPNTAGRPLTAGGASKRPMSSRFDGRLMVPRTRPLSGFSSSVSGERPSAVLLRQESSVSSLNDESAPVRRTQDEF